MRHTCVSHQRSCFYRGASYQEYVEHSRCLCWVILVKLKLGFNNPTDISYSSPSPFSQKLVWSVTDIVVKRGMSVSRLVGIIILSNWASLPAICPKVFIQCAWGNILVLFLTLISTINFIGVPPAIKSSYQVLEALRFSASHEVRWRRDYRARCDFR